MPGDYNRFTFHPQKDIASLWMQQGRVMLGSDWNELSELLDRRTRAETMDSIGRAVVPKNTIDGFRILFAGADLSIGVGRAYVDGLVAENHGAPPPAPHEFDSTLGEVRGAQPILYSAQPYFPNSPALPGGGPHLVFLDVWDRELTWIQDPDHVEKAVGVDTAAWIQTVWQVKLLPKIPTSVTCASPGADIPGWLDLIGPSAGRLTTTASGVPASTDPCIVPPNGGFRGTENRLYRVEIHTGGLGTATFKWSRDNASVASPVTAMNGAADTLTVVRIGRDSVLRFQPGDWVEVTDDVQEFAGSAGDMCQVTTVDEVQLAITVAPPLPAGKYNPTDLSRHTRVVRWDQRGIVRDSLGNVIVDVDATGGLIPVPATGDVVLEDGVQVSFTLDPGTGNFHVADYWSFAARTVDASVELLDHAPPRGILHHFARLAIVTFPAAGTPTDCRTLWPPDFGGSSCDCTVCVTAAGHNAGTAGKTIQDAIQTVITQGGGKICLGPGVYNIARTLAIAGGFAIEIAGHGLPALKAVPGFPDKEILLIQDSLGVTLSDVTIAAGTVAAGGPGGAPLTGIALRNTFSTRIARGAFMFGDSGAIVATGRTLQPAIGLTQQVVDTDVHDCLFNNVSVGIGDLPNVKDPRTVLSLRVARNEFICANGGLELVIPLETSFGELRFADNSVQAPVGFSVVGAGIDVTVASNTFNVLAQPAATPGPSFAVFSNLHDTSVLYNRIFGDPASVTCHGVGFGPTLAGMNGAQVIGNRIDTLGGAGILIPAGATLLQTMIAQNQLSNLGGPAIITLGTQQAPSILVDLNICDNALTNIWLNPAGLASLGSREAVAVYFFEFSMVVNLSITGNSIENVGLAAAPPSTTRGAIAALILSGGRVSRNRILNIGADESGSGGLGLAVVHGFLEVAENEVRRFEPPPAGGDNLKWRALILSTVAEGAPTVSVRGNLLESFGASSTVMVQATASLIFNDNHCIYDNPTADETVPVVDLAGSPLMANGNMVRRQPAGIGMRLTVPTREGRYAVVGNVVQGGIQVITITPVKTITFPAETLIPQLPPGPPLNVTLV